MQFPIADFQNEKMHTILATCERLIRLQCFWRKNSNLEKKGKFYKQFKIGSFFNFFRK